MTTSPHAPDDDAPPTREEEFDDAGRFVGDDAVDADDRTAGTERVVAAEEVDATDPEDRYREDEAADREPPVVQPRSG